MQIPAQDFRTSIFLALDLEKKIQIADSFRDDIMVSRTPTTVNEVQSFPLEESCSINEISNYRNSNSNNHGKNNYGGKPRQQKNNNKPWQNRDNKLWQNRDNKSMAKQRQKVMAKQQEQR